MWENCGEEIEECLKLVVGFDDDFGEVYLLLISD